LRLFIIATSEISLQLDWDMALESALAAENLEHQVLGLFRFRMEISLQLDHLVLESALALD
jgi:hypothetical protein